MVDIGPQWQDAGIVPAGTINYIDSLNPFVGYETQSYNTYNMLYPQLVQYNAHQQLVGDSAKSWSSNSAGTVWTFHLRPGGNGRTARP